MIERIRIEMGSNVTVKGRRRFFEIILVLALCPTCTNGRGKSCKREEICCDIYSIISTIHFLLSFVQLLYWLENIRRPA